MISAKQSAMIREALLSKEFEAGFSRAWNRSAEGFNAEHGADEDAFRQILDEEWEAYREHSDDANFVQIIVEAMTVAISEDGPVNMSRVAAVILKALRESGVVR